MTLPSLPWVRYGSVVQRSMPGAMSAGAVKVPPPSCETDSHGRATALLSTRRHQIEVDEPVMDSGMFQIPLFDHQATYTRLGSFLSITIDGMASAPNWRALGLGPMRGRAVVAHVTPRSEDRER